MNEKKKTKKKVPKKSQTTKTDETKTSKAAKEQGKEFEVKKIDRLTASVICLGEIKERISSKAAIKKANEIYVKHGGKSNLKEAKFSFDRVVKVLTLVKLFRVNGRHISRSPIY